MRPLQAVALHRERYVFPVTLKVTKVSGCGVDSIFMGIVKVRARRVCACCDVACL
jgi:hypothetical protein